VYGRLIYTVIYMSDRLLTQENQNPHLTPPTDLRSNDPNVWTITKAAARGHTAVVRWAREHGAPEAVSMLTYNGY